MRKLTSGMNWWAAAPGGGPHHPVHANPAPATAEQIAAVHARAQGRPPADS